MKTSTYVILDNHETVVGEFDPPLQEGMDPAARLHLGRLFEDNRVTVAFASLAQIDQTIAELQSLAESWRVVVHQRHMAQMAAGREMAS